MARLLRLANVALGAWVAVSPFLYGSASFEAQIAHVLLGLAVAALSLPRGRRSGEHYAGWDRFVL